MDALRVLLNVVWLVLQGWILALAYLLAGLIACLLIVTIPFGIASLRLAGFVVWPFGRTTVRAPGAGVASAVGNVLWFLFAGWWLALIHIEIESPEQMGYETIKNNLSESSSNDDPYSEVNNISL